LPKKKERGGIKLSDVGHARSLLRERSFGRVGRFEMGAPIVQVVEEGKAALAKG
jgi:hypothetical protein